MTVSRSMRRRAGALLWPLAGAVALAFAGAVYAGPGHDHSKDHKEHKNPLAGAPEHAEPGKLAPDFTLTDTEGNEHTLSSYLSEGKTVVLEWFNPDCPFVKKHHVSNKTMAELSDAYAEQGVVWLAINSGAPGKQGHGLERNLKAMEEYGIDYPLLLDESGAVGLAYGAKTTPTMFVIDPEGIVLFDGPIDDVPKPNEMGKTVYVRDVLDALAHGKDVEPQKLKSYGCSVKYAS